MRCMKLAKLSVSKFPPKTPQDDVEKVVVLSDSATMRLEELMMEGDLLEVALDETEHIWRILSHTYSTSKSVRKYAMTDQMPMTMPMNHDSKDTKKIPQQRGRKRKSDEFDLMKKLAPKRLEEKTALKRKSLNKEQTKSPVPPTGQMKRGPRKVQLYSLRKQHSHVVSKRNEPCSLFSIPFDSFRDTYIRTTF